MRYLYIALAALLAAAIIFVVLGAALFVNVLGRGAAHEKKERRTRRRRRSPSPGSLAFRAAIEDVGRYVAGTPHQKVSLRSSDGLLLRATYLPAAEPSKRTAIVVHGYTMYGLGDSGALLAPKLRELGLNALYVDDRAHGESEGRYIGFGWLDRRDVLDWCRWVAERCGEDSEILLCGVSMGAATVLLASGEADLPPQVRWVLEDCGYTSGWDEIRYCTRKLYHLASFPLMQAMNLMCRVFAGYSLRRCRPIDAVRRAKTPYLFIHGGSDRLVPTEMGRQLFEACPTSKELLIVDGAAHARSYLTDRDAYLAAFVRLLAK